MDRIRLIQADITRLDVTAIVNAANQTLLGGGGVDGAIHAAAGPELLEACRKLNGCPTGEARITPGFRLRATYVIHTVGPVWRGGEHNEDQLLASCYRKSLALAVEHQIADIAFPNISTGVYGFPKERAARIALSEVSRFLEDQPDVTQVIFVVFDSENLDIYRNLMKAF